LLALIGVHARLYAQPAQNYPGAALIENAAARMNSVTPPPMPEQIIQVGNFDGTTGRFGFLLPEYYPPNVPAGRMQPEHVANIASYNVTYVFNIRNKPAGFGITVTLHDAHGDTTEVPATIDPTGTKATVRFHPNSFAMQTVRIRKPVRDTVVMITPHLREELGVFVVPYLLVGIVYEPPGVGSTANYSQTKTVNTVISWNAAQTSGIVKTIDPGKFYKLANSLIGLGLNKLQPDAGTVWDTVAALADDPTVTKTTTVTTATGQSSSFSIAVTVGFNTTLHQYPGNGDLFIVLHDVLFGYLAKDGEVALAPLMYAGAPDYLTAAEMVQKLPAKVAASFKGMDPHFGNATIASLPPSSRPTVVLAGAALRARPRLVPFQPMTSLACKYTGSPELTLAQSDFTSTTTSQTQSETDINHNTGLIYSILGSGDSTHTVTYTTAREQGSGQTQSTTITLLCAQNEEFWVDVYFDDIFRTFYTLQGDPLSASPPIVGTVQTATGQAAANQQVKLRIGDHTYVVVTDKVGNFAFPLGAAPRGAATITVAGQNYDLTLAGSPRNVLLRSGTVTDRR
jgi:hypothetical protein